MFKHHPTQESVKSFSKERVQLNTCAIALLTRSKNGHTQWQRVERERMILIRRTS